MPATSQEELNRQLFAAVKAKEATAAEALLEAGADANARLPGEDSLLCLAVETDDARLVGLIAAHTRYLDITDDCDASAFTHATRHNRDAAAHALLDAGASPFPPGGGADYPLDWAVANKMYGLIGRMLKMGWSDRLYKDEPLIVYAVKTEDLELAQACIDAGANVNRGEKEHGFTALHMAARKSSETLIRFLLDNNASLEIKANGWQTPFDWDSTNLLRQIVTEREMIAAARELTEGAPESITVRPPVRFKKSPNV
jgi:ankyrin repeat protein